MHGNPGCMVHTGGSGISMLLNVDGWSEDAIGRALDLLSRDCGLLAMHQCGVTLGKYFTPICFCHQTV